MPRRALVRLDCAGWRGYRGSGGTARSCERGFHAALAAPRRSGRSRTRRLSPAPNPCLPFRVFDHAARVQRFKCQRGRDFRVTLDDPGVQRLAQLLGRFGKASEGGRRLPHTRRRPRDGCTQAWCEQAQGVTAGPPESRDTSSGQFPAASAPPASGACPRELADPWRR